MKKLMKLAGRFAVVAAVCGVVSFLPVIPVEIGPVVLDPVYRPAMVSLEALIVSPIVMGERILGTWATIPVLLLLLTAMFVGSRRLSRLVIGHT